MGQESSGSPRAGADDYDVVFFIWLPPARLERPSGSSPHLFIARSQRAQRKSLKNRTPTTYLYLALYPLLAIFGLFAAIICKASKVFLSFWISCYFVTLKLIAHIAHVLFFPLRTLCSL
jgi:hypothetical protein